MIDVENDVFNYVAQILRAKYPGIFVTSEYVEEKAQFPAVSIVEADNYVFERMRTDNIENAVQVMYEVNVYSNKTSGKKTEAKQIAETIDNAMSAAGFTRNYIGKVPNFADATIYRIVSRYRGVVGPNGTDKFLIYQN